MIPASAGPDAGATVRKLMSCTRAEFETGVERLTGAPPRRLPTGAYDLTDAAGGRTVACTFEPQADAVLGGLVRLPRVLVTLDLAALPAGERCAFVLRFDRTFQRGGG